MTLTFQRKLSGRVAPCARLAGVESDAGGYELEQLRRQGPVGLRERLSFCAERGQCQLVPRQSHHAWRRHRAPWLRTSPAAGEEGLVLSVLNAAVMVRRGSRGLRIGAVRLARAESRCIPACD